LRISGVAVGEAVEEGETSVVEADEGDEGLSVKVNEGEDEEEEEIEAEEAEKVAEAGEAEDDIVIVTLTVV